MSVKMTLTAYSKNDFKQALKEIGPYVLMINPEEIKVERSISYDQSKGQKKYGLYKESSAITCSFEFVIDGTGVVETPPKDVNASLDHFKRVVYNHVPSLSRPPFVEIAYCDRIFRCVLTSLNVTYTLFDLDGKPLRAKVSCSFVEVVEPPKEKKKKAPPKPPAPEKPIELVPGPPQLSCPPCPPCPPCNDICSKDRNMDIVVEMAIQTDCETIFMQSIVGMGGAEPQPFLHNLEPKMNQ